MKRIFILLLSFVFISGVSGQRGANSFWISYPIGFPMSNLSDYIDEISFRGITMEFNRKIKPNVDVGVEFGWSVFYKKESEKVYTEETASISGVQYRYTNAVPMLLGAKYYFGGGGKVQPYGGVGIGVTFISRATDFGLYRIITEAWQFCVRPEAGVLIPFNANVSGVVGAKYYANFGTDELDGQPYLGLNLGVVFTR